MSTKYQHLRSNAIRRGKEFKLTLEEFAEFCQQTNYIELSGKSTNSMSIDRIDSSKGYSADNIQMVTLAYNARKEHAERKIRQRYGTSPPDPNINVDLSSLPLPDPIPIAPF